MRQDALLPLHRQGKSDNGRGVAAQHQVAIEIEVSPGERRLLLLYDTPIRDQGLAARLPCQFHRAIIVLLQIVVLSGPSYQLGFGSVAALRYTKNVQGPKATGSPSISFSTRALSHKASAPTHAAS